MKASPLALVALSSTVLAAAHEQAPMESVKADHDAVLDRHFGGGPVQLRQK
jgi:hypothetical protein